MQQITQPTVTSAVGLQVNDLVMMHMGVSASSFLHYPAAMLATSGNDYLQHFIDALQYQIHKCNTVCAQPLMLANMVPEATHCTYMLAMLAMLY